MRVLFTLKFVRFFLCDQPYRYRDTLETSELVSPTENFSASTWFIHVDGLSNYLPSFQKNPSANFLKITAVSLIRNTLAINVKITHNSKMLILFLFISQFCLHEPPSELCFDYKWSKWLFVFTFQIHFNNYSYHISLTNLLFLIFYLQLTCQNPSTICISVKPK